MSQLFPGAVVEPVELAEAKGVVCIRTASVEKRIAQLSRLGQARPEARA